MLAAAAVISFTCPFLVTPDWGAMRSPKEWNRKYSQYESSELIPVPSYDIKKLVTPMKDLGILRDKNDPSAIPLMTAKLFYSTRFGGTYDVDSAENVLAVNGEHTGGHEGVDLKEPLGMRVRAIAPGMVTKRVIGDKIFGNYVEVTHKDGFVSLYGHMNLLSVRRMQYVRARQVLGTVGLTGNTAGPHLHLGLFKDGVLVNPMSYVKCGK